jgi:hypothetical protein
MTNVQNTARYFFVPGVTIGIPGGTSGAVNFPDFSFSDITLGAEATNEAVLNGVNYFALFSQDHSGLGPFSPFLVLSYGDRLICLTALSDGSTGAFVSQPNKPQWITLAQSLIQLPGKLTITCGFVLGQSLYLVGPAWTYAFSDNNNLPISWAKPRQIDGSIGTMSPVGVAVNSSLGYAFVADTAGLQYLTGGAYAQKPISYLTPPDWERINWAAPAGTIQVRDVPSHKMVFVKAPLDGAVSANALLAWDYSLGIAWDRVNYCGLWDSAAFPDIGAIEQVLNPTKKIYELWLSRYGAGKVYRSKSVAAGDGTSMTDAALYSDDGTGINWQYQSCALPKQVFPEPQQWVAVKTRLRGNGTINPQAKTLDQTRSHALTAITAVNAPGQWALNLLDVQSEGLYVQYDNGSIAGAWGIIAGFEVFWNPDWVMQR